MNVDASDRAGQIHGHDFADSCGPDCPPLRLAVGAYVYPTDIPGLCDVQMPDGSWRHDVTVGQLRQIALGVAL